MACAVLKPRRERNATTFSTLGILPAFRDKDIAFVIDVYSSRYSKPSLTTGNWSPQRKHGPLTASYACCMMQLHRRQAFLTGIDETGCCRHITLPSSLMILSSTRSRPPVWTYEDVRRGGLCNRLFKTGAMDMSRSSSATQGGKYNRIAADSRPCP